MSPPPKGTVTVTHLRDGTLAFALRFRVEGRRERKTVHERRDCNCGCGGGWNERTANVELENQLARVRAGVWERPRASDPHPPASPKRAVPTFHEYASWWLQAKTDGTIGRRPLRPNTRADYLWRLRRHLLPFFGRYRLDEIDKGLCLEFKARKLKEADELRAVADQGVDLRDPRTNKRARPLNLASVKKLINTLIAILDEAIEDEHLSTNPARSRRMKVSVPEPKRTFVEIDELVAVLDAAGAQDQRRPVPPKERLRRSTATKVVELLNEGMRPLEISEELGIATSTVSYHATRLGGSVARPYVGRRVVVATLGLSGVRASELCDLKLGHLRLHDADGGRFRVPDSKTQAGVRVVEMSPDLVAEWKLHIDRLRRAGRSLDPDAWAIPNLRGGRMNRQRVAAIVREAASHASERQVVKGLPPLQHTTPHSLRRTYISIALLANNFDVLWVMSQVGHSDSKMTMDVYAQLQQRVKRDHGKAFDALVQRARGQVLGVKRPSAVA